MASKAVIAVLVVVLLVAVGYYLASRAPPYPGYVSPATVSKCLGGAWTLSASSSFVATINTNSGTADVRYFNGTSATVPLGEFGGSSSLGGELWAEYVFTGITKFGSYTYSGLVDGQQGALTVEVAYVPNTTVAERLYERLGVLGVVFSGAVPVTINGAHAVVAVGSGEGEALALKGNYVASVTASASGLTYGGMECLLSAVLSNVSGLP